MAESSLHLRMKSIMMKELKDEDYSVVAEPLSPPMARVTWASYRPDIMGYRSEEGREEIALVECETHPNMRRFRLKNSLSVRFQPFLFREGSMRRILAVPKGRLGSVDLELRSAWEIWVLGDVGPICRIGRITDDRKIEVEPIRAPLNLRS